MMEAALSWGTNPNDFETTREAASMVDEVYRDYRNRGLRADHALEQTALNFQISKRRVRSFLEGEFPALIIDEWIELRRRFLAHLDNEAEFAMKRANERLTRRRAMEQERTELRRMRG